MMVLEIEEAERRTRALYLARGVNLEDVRFEVKPLAVRSYCEWVDGTVTVTVGALLMAAFKVAPGKGAWYLAHEFAHAWGFRIQAVFDAEEGARWHSYFGDPAVQSKACTPWGAGRGYPKTEFVSWYATSSPQEDFAETVAAVLLGSAAPANSILEGKMKYVGSLLALERG